MLALWREKYKYSGLTTDNIKKWQECIEKEVSDSEEKKLEICYLLKIYAEKYPTPENYCRFFDHAGYNDREFLLKALADCGVNYVSSHKLWEKIEQNSEIGPELFAERLLVPHREIQATYEKYSSWVSSHTPELYTQSMREASKMVRETEKVMRYIEKLESQVTETPDDPQVWITYMKKLSKFASKVYNQTEPLINYNTIRQVFLRSLSYGQDRVSDVNWIPVWIAYIRILEGSEEIFYLGYYLQTINEFCRSFSYLAEAYIPLLRNVCIEEEVWSLLKLVLARINTNGWAESAEELIGASVRADLGPMKCAKLLKPFGEIAATTSLHEDHKLFLLIISWLERTTDVDAISLAKSLVIEFFENFASETDAWIFCFQFFTRHLEKHAKKLLTLWELDALEVDKPEKLLNEILLYARMNSPAYAYINTMNLVDLVREQLDSGVVQETAPEKTVEEPAKKKTKSIPHNEELLGRNREQFRLVLSPVTTDITEEDIRTFFEGYGKPISVQIADNCAIVELNSEQEVMTCLTRDIKPLKGEPVKISRLFANTLWITNYPPHFSLRNVTDMINSFGKTAIDVRLPLQNDLKQRRFCYADFSDPETAQHVRNRLNGLEVENYTVQAEISNPTLRKERKTPPIARQVYAHNLNFKQTTEQTLRELFLKFGDVESIKLPLNETNKNRGNMNNGFAFVTFTTEAAAKEALKLGGAQLDGRRIEISAVKTKQVLHNINASHFKADNTVSIQNISELVTSEQLKVFLGEKVGPVSKLLLQPSTRSALVEFEAFKDAGKVGLLLEGVDYQDHILHVGLKDDFVKSGTKPKPPIMVPPMLMRRRRK